MLYQVFTAEKLYKRGEITSSELHGYFDGQTVIQFPFGIHAYTFAAGFIENRIKMGINKNFPMRVRIRKDQAWLVIPTDRYGEVRKYIEEHPLPDAEFKENLENKS